MTIQRLEKFNIIPLIGPRRNGRVRIEGLPADSDEATNRRRRVIQLLRKSRVNRIINPGPEANI